MSHPVGPLVESLFRRSAARLTAALLGTFGAARLDRVEEAVQEAMLRALRVWPHTGVPDAPEAWLLTVARRAAYDGLRREQVRARRAAEPEAALAEPAPAGERAAEDLVALLFLCAHPVLPRASRLALTLKVACGFSVGEIAALLLAEPDAVEKRLVRARQRLREQGADCVQPTPRQRLERLDTVLEVVALLFTEGHAASGDGRAVREELCREALHLGEQLLRTPATARPEVHALLALMCFHSSRLATRLDADGVPVPLAEQDRARWDRAAIARGFAHLQHAMLTERPTRYHLEAAIASCHAAAPSVAATDWAAVVRFYDDLLALAPSPVTAVHRAVALGFARGPEAGLTELAALGAALPRYAPRVLAEAALLERAGRVADARGALAWAAQLPLRAGERRWLARELARLAGG